MNPGRSINEAAQRLAEAEDWRLTEVAIHDPDMIRDVARAMLAATPVPEITKEPFGYVLTTGMASGYDFVTNKHEADDHMITEAAYKPECIPVWTHQPADTRAKALEEAAKICEGGYWAYGQDKTLPVSLQCAAAIRAAITRKP